MCQSRQLSAISFADIMGFTAILQEGEVLSLSLKGGFMGGILPPIEKRIKAIILVLEGMWMNKTFPEVDQINYLPRVNQPVFMFIGGFDMIFPLETGQKSMFELLVTPDKKFLLYEFGHVPPPVEVVKETLNWLDKYLGP